MNDLQRTPEWHLARLGKLTGSRIGDATAKTKKGDVSASREQYLADLVLERLTGEPTETYQSKAMLDGIEREPLALASYEMARNVAVELVGFVPHPRIAMAGCSPDGLIGGTEGMVEIKCPMPAQHMRWLLGAAADLTYYKQIQWGMACTGRCFCDFISWQPSFPLSMRLFVRRVLRDSKMISDLEAEGGVFLADVDQTHRELLARYGMQQASALLEQLKASVAAL